MSRATQLAPSAYLSSTAATADLVSAILPTSHKTLPTPFADAALEKWSVGHNATPPTGAGAAIEKCWVESKVIRVAEALQDGASDEVERARLLAARDKDSGAWLQALPITSVGLRMDDDTLRTAVGLRLGTAICAPHNCQLCGAQVSQFGTHGLIVKVATLITLPSMTSYAAPCPVLVFRPGWNHQGSCGQMVRDQTV